MSRSSNIPPLVGRSVIRHWLNGESAQEIVDWIMRTNHRRREPVETSRSGVNRLIERYSYAESAYDSSAPDVRRCRARAHKALDGLEDVETRFLQLFEEAEKMDGSMESRTRFSALLRTAKGYEQYLRRNLKLSGIEARVKEPDDQEFLDATWKEMKELALETREELADDGETPAREESSDDENELLWAPQVWGAPPEKPVRNDPEFAGKTCTIDPDGCAGSVPALTGGGGPPCPPAAQPRVAGPTTMDVRGTSKRGGHGGPPPPERTECVVPAKPGRNALCPCGSKLKYKRCCGLSPARFLSASEMETSG
jgi:hypothetical protein